MMPRCPSPLSTKQTDSLRRQRSNDIHARRQRTVVRDVHDLSAIRSETQAAASPGQEGQEEREQPEELARDQMVDAPSLTRERQRRGTRADR